MNAPHFVIFKTNEENFVQFLIDTGTDICKEDFIGSKEIKEHNPCRITGIENKAIHTMRTTILRLVFPEDKINFKHQIAKKKKRISYCDRQYSGQKFSY